MSIDYGARPLRITLTALVILVLGALMTIGGGYLATAGPPPSGATAMLTSLLPLQRQRPPEAPLRLPPPPKPLVQIDLVDRCSLLCGDSTRALQLVHRLRRLAPLEGLAVDGEDDVADEQRAAREVEGRQRRREQPALFVSKSIKRHLIRYQDQTFTGNGRLCSRFGFAGETGQRQPDRIMAGRADHACRWHSRCRYPAFGANQYLGCC